MKVDRTELPEYFPTHRHSSEFWEQLGRTIATFGFLEEILGKAIFAFTATRDYPVDEVDAAYARWLPTLEKALFGQLHNLIESYGKAVRDNKKAMIAADELERLLAELKKSSTFRNVLCHGSWRSMPDAKGYSIPFFVNNNLDIFDTPVNAAFLEQLRRHVVESICLIIETVTDMGWQFPGSSFPGKKIWET